MHSANRLQRSNKEVRRRAVVVGIFSNEGAIIRLIGAVPLEANDQLQLQHRDMQTEAMAELTPTLVDPAPPDCHPWWHDQWPPQRHLNFRHVDGQRRNGRFGPRAAAWN